MVLQAPGPDGYQWASSFLAKSCTQSMLAWEWGSQNKKLLGVCLMPFWVVNWGILFSCQRWSMASGIEQKKTEVELIGSVSACHLWGLPLCPQTRKKIPGHGSTSLKSQHSEDLGGGMQQVEVVMVVWGQDGVQSYLISENLKQKQAGEMTQLIRTCIGVLKQGMFLGLPSHPLTKQNEQVKGK